MSECDYLGANRRGTLRVTSGRTTAASTSLTWPASSRRRGRPTLLRWRCAVRSLCCGPAAAPAAQSRPGGWFCRASGFGASSLPAHAALLGARAPASATPAAPGQRRAAPEEDRGAGGRWHRRCCGACPARSPAYPAPPRLPASPPLARSPLHVLHALTDVAGTSTSPSPARSRPHILLAQARGCVPRPARLRLSRSRGRGRGAARAAAGWWRRARRRRVRRRRRR